MIENFQFSAVCLASRQVTSSPLPPTPAPPAPTPTTLPSGEQYPGHRRHMRTRPYCFALLLPCTGVRIAQAYRRKRPTMFVAGGVCIYPVCSYMSVQYTMQYRRPYTSRTAVIFWFSGQTNTRSGRGGARCTFPRRACMAGSSRSLCPFPFAYLKNAKK